MTDLAAVFAAPDAAGATVGTAATNYAAASVEAEADEELMALRRELQTLLSAMPKKEKVAAPPRGATAATGFGR
eukprot:3778107-Pleurochrysis_carterae.AAC.1